MSSRGARAAFGVAIGLILAAATPAGAVAPSWLRHVFESPTGARNKAPPVARYAIDTGGDFVLDRTTAPHPLLKFEDSPEVWALTVSRGPRGDLIYWNDLRQPFLRITKFGGVTVFTPDRPQGAAAAVAGPGAPLRLASVGAIGLYQHLAVASARSGRAAQHPVGYTAIDADPTSDGLMADAAIVTSEAMVNMAMRPRGRAFLRRIGRVAIIRGDKPGAIVREGVVVVTVAPTAGIFGRPSSLRIEQALTER
jgi:hypothetical protein